MYHRFFFARSFSATLIDHLKLQSDQSFKGKSIFEKGKFGSIVENTGRGYCDIKERDIFFTITTLEYKVMFVLIENNLFPVKLYNKINDPKEYKNLLSLEINKGVLDLLAAFLIKERKELLLMRNLAIKKIIKKKYKWIVMDYMIDKYRPPKLYNKV